MIAADDAGAVETSHTLVRSRHRQADRLRDLGIGEPVVDLQQTSDLPVYVVHDR